MFLQIAHNFDTSDGDQGLKSNSPYFRISYDFGEAPSTPGMMFLYSNSKFVHQQKGSKAF